MQNRFGIELGKIEPVIKKKMLFPSAAVLGLDATIADIIPHIFAFKRNKQVEKIEEALLGGKILPEFAYEDDSHHISLHLLEASSGVQELWAMLPILHQAMSDCEEGSEFLFLLMSLRHICIRLRK